MALTLKSTLTQITDELTQVSATPRLDAEILLASVLEKKRSYLYTYPEILITADQHNNLLRLVKRRQQGEPIAYILEQKEFWSLSLKVNKATLIPRPETELLVELALQKLAVTENLMVADLGTGSGAVALALASERSNWQLYATDKSQPALMVAQQNAKHFQLKNIEFKQGNWCHALPNCLFDAIISNPPYIAEYEQHVTEGIEFEPTTALFSAEDGLADIKIILGQAVNYLKTGGVIMLEHGYRQATAIRKIMLELGYINIETYLDMSGQPRVTLGFI